MNKKYLIFTLIVLIFSLHVYSNWQEQVDSLKGILSKDMTDSARALIHYAIAEELISNKPEEANEHILQVIYIAENLNNSTLLYDGYIILSDFFYFANDYESTLEYIYKAYEIAGQDKSMLSNCHNRLSETFYFIDDLDKSIFHARKACAINTELQDTLQLTYDYHSIATWHLELNNYDSALFYLYKSINLYQYLNVEPDPIFYSHLGQTYSYMNQFDSALHYHFIAFDIDSLSNSVYNMAIDENYIGNTYFRQKKYEKAVKYVQRSLRRAKDLELMDVLSHNYELLSEIYSAKQDYKKALECSELCNDYNDTLRDKNKESIIQGLNAKYKFSEQQQKLQANATENLHLKKQKTLLTFLSIVSLLFVTSMLLIVVQTTQKNKANRILLNELEIANSSKERMLSVISHDLRSSIGTLRNSVQLVSDDSIDHETIVELIKCFSPVVDSTYDLLENLLTWASYNKDTLEPSIKDINIKPLLEKSIQHTQHLANTKNILIVNEIEGVIVKADKNMLSTILRNLISNAVKFSHPKSKVVITSITKENMAEITIKDDGIGMKPEVMNHLFTQPTDFHSKGTLGERGSGLGLSMCKTFIEKQGGAIWANSKLAEGSSFTFSIPLS